MRSSSIAALGDLIWPLACGGCQRTGESWCSQCAALLTGPARVSWPRPAPPGLPPPWATAAYAGEVRRAIVAWKDRGRHDLTRPLGAGLSRAVLAALSAGDAPTASGPISLVPMPSRSAARRSRGGEPVRDLCRTSASIARRHGWNVRVLAVLRHSRSVVDQAGLDAAARRQNLAQALTVAPYLADLAAAGPCLLVDDIVTTGATLAEAARALREVGGHPFGAAVVAATARTGSVE